MGEMRIIQHPDCFEVREAIAVERIAIRALGPADVKFLAPTQTPQQRLRQRR